MILSAPVCMSARMSKAPIFACCDACARTASVGACCDAAFERTFPVGACCDAAVAKLRELTQLVRAVMLSVHALRLLSVMCCAVGVAMLPALALRLSARAVMLPLSVPSLLVRAAMLQLPSCAN